MDIPLVLSILCPTEDWGPCANTFNTYAELAATWRGKKPVPSLESMRATWDSIQADQTPEKKQERAQIQATRELNDLANLEPIWIILRNLEQRLAALERPAQE